MTFKKVWCKLSTKIQEKLRKYIIKKARFLKGNIKLGNMWTWSTLKGNDTYTLNIMGFTFDIKGTCGKHCKGCSKACYVNKSYRYPSVKLAHAIRTIALRYFDKELFESLSNQITNAKNKPTVIRLNQSGEIENKQQFKGFCLLANKHKEQTFYIYTKNYEVVVPMLLNDEVPANLIVNISIWHNQGIKQFNQVKHLPNVKAFVYDDGFNYKELKATTSCKAYENGKLNHNITCDKCKKCFAINDLFKIIYCKEH